MNSQRGVVGIGLALAMVLMMGICVGLMMIGGHAMSRGRDAGHDNGAASPR